MMGVCGHVEFLDQCSHPGFARPKSGGTKIEMARRRKMGWTLMSRQPAAAMFLPARPQAPAGAQDR
jgi:hypothetical protein